jgi:hypothetical protein
VVSFDRSLLKGEAPRFSADFNHPLLYERPFKFPRRPLGIDNIIAVSAINIHSAIFKLRKHGNGHGNRNGHGNKKRTWKLKRKLTIHRNGHGHGNGHGQGIGELLLSFSYGAIVLIAPYECL